MINPTTHAISEFTTGLDAHAAPDDITVGADGTTLWFTDSGANAIGMLNPTTNPPTIQEFSTGLSANALPTGIAESNGNLWFTEYNNGKLGMLNPTTTPPTIQEFSTSLPGNSLYTLPGITAGPDGNLWFTAGGIGQIGTINPSTHVISAFDTTSQADPQAITVGPDGNVWFTEINLPYSGSGGVLYGGGIGVATLDTQLNVTTQPPSSVTAGVGFDFTAKVMYSTGVVDTDFSGNVTVALATNHNPGGSTLGGTKTVPVVNGVASFSDLTLNNLGTGYQLQVSGTGPTSGTSNLFNVLVLPTITWAPPASIVYGTVLSGTQLDASASYLSNGNTVSVPGRFVYAQPAGTVLGAGDNQTLSVTFTPTDTTDFMSATGTTTISVAQATPTITWTNPASIVSGTALSGTQLDASASYIVGGTMVSVPGTYVYTPAAGTALSAGNDQTLSVIFKPNDSTDYTSATANVTINVTPSTTPTPTIVAEQIKLVSLRHNKHGKPIGKPVVEIVFHYSTAMNPATADNPGNYQVNWTSTKKVKTKVVKVVNRGSQSRPALVRRAVTKTTIVTVLHPVSVVSATSDPTNTVVTVATMSLASRFAKGGQITVIGSPPGGVNSAADAYLGGNPMFTISPKARGIGPIA